MSSKQGPSHLIRRMILQALEDGPVGLAKLAERHRGSLSQFSYHANVLLAEGKVGVEDVRHEGGQLERILRIAR